MRIPIVRAFSVASLLALAALGGCSSNDAAPVPVADASADGDLPPFVTDDSDSSIDASVPITCPATLADACAAPSAACPPRDLAGAWPALCADDPSVTRVVQRSGRFVVVTTLAKADAPPAHVREADVYDADAATLVAVFRPDAAGALACVAGPATFDYDEGPVTPLEPPCTDGGADAASDAPPDDGG